MFSCYMSVLLVQNNLTNNDAVVLAEESDTTDTDETEAATVMFSY